MSDFVAGVPGQDIPGNAADVGAAYGPVHSLHVRGSRDGRAPELPALLTLEEVEMITEFGAVHVPGKPGSS